MEAPVATWLVIEVHSAQLDSMEGPIVVDAFPNEQKAAEHAQYMAEKHPGIEYGLFVMLETCAAASQATWTKCEV